jgi:transposase
MELHISATKKKQYKQDEKAVKEWLLVTYPEIVKQAEAENAEIWWVDETGVRNASNYIKGYAPLGVTPTLPVASHHIRVSMISAITNKGKLRYHFYRGKFNQNIFMGFLKRLIKSTDRKVFVISDNSSTHHGLLVTDWKEKNSQRITIFYLPPYVPELNPVEYLNNNLKRDLLYRGYSKNQEEVKMKAMSIMRSIQSTKKRVASFFDNEHVKYAKYQERL